MRTCEILEATVKTDMHIRILHDAATFVILSDVYLIRLKYSYRWTKFKNEIFFTLKLFCVIFISIVCV